MNTERFSEIVAEAREHFNGLVLGPDNELGAGHNPSKEVADGRRDIFARRAKHLAGPIAKKAKRATTRAKAWRLYSAVKRCDSVAGYQIFQAIIETKGDQ